MTDGRVRGGYPARRMNTKSHNKSFQAPKGTRDFYPEELLRRRYIAETWRAVSIRHGFEEIDGPTFEHADLYTVKSGEGILSELFSFRREGGDDLYALRPEFTPTLARMYAARARQLPSPTRWFCIPNFFRAENPQRGRLREFFQWNVDVLGDTTPNADGDVAACLIDCLRTTGLGPDVVRLDINLKGTIADAAKFAGVSIERMESVYSYIDAIPKLNPAQRLERQEALGLTELEASRILDTLEKLRIEVGLPDADWERSGRIIEESRFDDLMNAINALILRTFERWWYVNPYIVRGLAYYTGTVFEVIAEGERAIAGGGRYDNLIELFGGPPTPACGFGMGDVVLSLVLEDRGLMPKGMGELMDAVECVMRSYSMRPDAFVFSNGDEAAEAKVVPLMAELRRGVESPDYQGKPWRPERYEVRPMHVRTTGKSTRNVGKLMKDAASSNARFAVILESGEHATVKDLTTGDEHKDTPIEKIARMIAGG
ncbi:MAG: ATP phosphoribosyltransferase regulatory subunit [Phycisphaerales bacterium]|nr:ATP phosphoribosyltransferase regulatory subunit [Phycisphaerales bacterium]